MSAIAKITSKGQVTLPRMIREHLAAKVIEFDLRDGEVTIRSVKSAAGSLSAYSKKHAPLKGVRGEVWKEVANAKAKNTPA